MKPSVHFRRTVRLQGPSAFTLVELLVVIVIIGLLMALGTPTFMSAMSANRLSAAGQNLVGRFSQAQQLAMSGNLPIEVRFYQFTDPGQVSPTNSYGAYQFLQVRNVSTGAAAGEALEPMGSPFYLESGIVVSSTMINSCAASPLLTGTGVAQFKDDGSGPGAVPQQIQKDSRAQYVAIRFLPDGTVKRVTSNNVAAGAAGTTVVLANITLADAYLTLVREKDATGNGTVANYYAVQVDPYTGHVRSYQPGL